MNWNLLVITLTWLLINNPKQYESYAYLIKLICVERDEAFLVGNDSVIKYQVSEDRWITYNNNGIDDVSPGPL